MGTRTWIGVLWMVMMGVLPGEAATIGGLVTDTSGAAVVGTRVVLRDMATRQEVVAQTGEDGRYTVEAPTPGMYLVSVAREGFSEAVETVIVERADQTLDVPLRLEVGSVAAAVVVTASRAERDVRQIPLHVDSITRAAVEQTNQLSTGDALTMAANITPGGQRAVRRAAAPARAGLDAPAGAGGRRAAEHRAPGDRSHRRRSGAGVAGRDQPHGGGQRRRHADVRVGRAGRHHQHHHQRSLVHATGAVAVRLQRLLQHERERHARHGHAGRHRAELHPAHPGRRGRLRQLHRPAHLDSEDTRPAVCVGHAGPGRHDRRQLRLQVQRVSRSVQRAVRAHRQRGAQLAGPRELRQRQRQHQGRRAALGARALSAPPDGGRRLSGLRRAVLLQRDGAAAQQPRPRVGALRSAGRDAVARQPVDDGVLPAHRTAAAERAAGPVSGAHARAPSSRSA